MINRFDRYIFFRMLKITVFILLLLIFIFIVIDFSEKSDDFTDQGATVEQIFEQYYLNYVPEMTRLVIPVAVFIACLILTGQMSDRFEIVALKAAGVSLYRLLIPYLVFAFIAAALISYLDGFVIPHTNAKRLKFEHEYLRKDNQQVDRDNIYRQESPNTLVRVNYYDAQDTMGYQIDIYKFQGDSIMSTLHARRMKWLQKKQRWQLVDAKVQQYNKRGFKTVELGTQDTTLNIYPRDMARTTSDIYQLTYPEAHNYIQSIKRSGAGGLSLPEIQFYGRLTYPFSIIVVTFIGFAIASVRRRGGKGVHIAVGLTISFLYLAFMKIIEPFGSSGEINPLFAASLPHLFFFVTGIVLLFTAKK